MRRARAAALIVRSARETDLPALAALYRELDLPGFTHDDASARAMSKPFRMLARDRSHHLLVAERRGEVIGTLHVLIFRHLGHGLRPAAIVENVVVRSGFRSQGVGEKMLEAARQIAMAERCYKIALTSHRLRRRAHRFYERLGWSRTHFGYSVYLQ
jgi:GNAT superfamily N-acetyltransferase